MSKYVIEIKPEYEDKIRGVMILGAENSNLYLYAMAVDELEELNSDYINEHFSDLQDTAYQRGLEEGNEIGYKDGVKDGQNEAWEAARKVILNRDEGGTSNLDLDEIFGCFTIQQVFRRYIVSEAIAKLKAYEEKQKADGEIKVGDEVISLRKNGEVFEDMSPWVVTYETKYSYQGFEAGGMFHNNPKERVRKTGRHFDIQKILEEMKE